MEAQLRPGIRHTDQFDRNSHPGSRGSSLPASPTRDVPYLPLKTGFSSAPIKDVPVNLGEELWLSHRSTHRLENEREQLLHSRDRGPALTRITDELRREYNHILDLRRRLDAFNDHDDVESRAVHQRATERARTALRELDQQTHSRASSKSALSSPLKRLSPLAANGRGNSRSNSPDPREVRKNGSVPNMCSDLATGRARLLHETTRCDDDRANLDLAQVRSQHEQQYLLRFGAQDTPGIRKAAANTSRGASPAQIRKRDQKDHTYGEPSCNGSEWKQLDGLRAELEKSRERSLADNELAAEEQRKLAMAKARSEQERDWLRKLGSSAIRPIVGSRRNLDDELRRANLAQPAVPSAGRILPPNHGIASETQGGGRELDHRSQHPVGIPQDNPPGGGSRLVVSWAPVDGPESKQQHPGSGSTREAIRPQASGHDAHALCLRPALALIARLRASMDRSDEAEAPQRVFSAWHLLARANIAEQQRDALSLNLDEARVRRGEDALIIQQHKRWLLLAGVCAAWRRFIDAAKLEMVKEQLADAGRINRLNQEIAETRERVGYYLGCTKWSKMQTNFLQAQGNVPPCVEESKMQANVSQARGNPPPRVEEPKMNPVEKSEINPVAARQDSERSSQGNKRALSVGINYDGKLALSGCRNDSHIFVQLLTTVLGYKKSDVRQLLDDDPSRMPTRENMLSAMRWLVENAKSGDELFLHYSGHGSQTPDLDGDERDGLDETLVPCDFPQTGKPLVDDELRALLVSPLPAGVSLICIFDCCHSGTALDLPFHTSLGGDGQVTVRSGSHCVGPTKANVILLSGCRDAGTSADLGSGETANGALTAAFKSVIEARPAASYHGVLSEILKILQEGQIQQLPQLTSEHHLDLTESFMPEFRKPSEALILPKKPPTRRALTIGINYLSLPPGKGRLTGCINDSNAMVKLLKQTLGYNAGDIRQLRDDLDADSTPTRSNMLQAFRWLTAGAAPGDDLFLHYSGHGGQMEDKSGDEPDGMDDTLIACDLKQITDDELHSILVRDLPRGCRLWVILDCCHSGTALDLRFNVTLLDDNESAEVRKSQSRRKSGGTQVSETSRADVLMISGCKDSQTSADVQAGSLGMNKAGGAMTTALLRALTPSISCFDLLKDMSSFIKSSGFTQVPQMSSEQFVNLESSYVHYIGERRSVAS